MLLLLLVARLFPEQITGATGAVGIEPNTSTRAKYHSLRQDQVPVCYNIETQSRLMRKFYWISTIVVEIRSNRRKLHMYFLYLQAVKSRRLVMPAFWLPLYQEVKWLVHLIFVIDSPKRTGPRGTAACCGGGWGAVC